MATLGDGATTSGDGESANMIRCGTTGKGSGDGCELLMAEAGAEGGDLAGAGEKVREDAAGVATLGSSWAGTLGRPGAGLRDGLLGGGLRRRHESRRSRRLVMASSWVMVVGSGVSLSAPEMTWRPWIILSSGEGDGMEW